MNILEINKYQIIRNFFSDYDIGRMLRRMCLLRDKGILVQDSQCSKSYAAYCDPIHSEMQEKYRDKLQEAIGLKLLPTYCYSRIYSPKEILYWHSDRPACEISITGTLSYDTFDDKPWTIFVECEKNILGSVKSVTASEYDKSKSFETYGRPVVLEPGDILIYKGCDINHWREKFVGVHQTQVFMHYVDANGPYTDCKYDFRTSLGSTSQTKDWKREEAFRNQHDKKFTREIS